LPDTEGALERRRERPKRIDSDPTTREPSVRFRPLGLLGIMLEVRMRAFTGKSRGEAAGNERR
jgi:hypothetical protein